MPFTPRSPGAPVPPDRTVAGPGSLRKRPLVVFTAFGLLLISGLAPHTALSQQVVGTAQAASSVSSVSGAQASGGPEADDPVARFLSDKGLIPSTRPVSELAQQVRDTATDLASELVLSAMNFLGVPYKRGGDSTETGFDCSGFTRHVFENSVGLILPRRAVEQANSPSLVPVQKAELKPGDLVFFNTLRHTFSHVGIYIGDNKFIHSPRAGGHVRVEDMRLAYWQKRYDGARRAPSFTAATLAPAPSVSTTSGAARPSPARN